MQKLNPDAILKSSEITYRGKKVDSTEELPEKTYKMALRYFRPSNIKGRKTFSKIEPSDKRDLHSHNPVAESFSTDFTQIFSASREIERRTTNLIHTINQVYSRFESIYSKVATHGKDSPPEDMFKIYTIIKEKSYYIGAKKLKRYLDMRDNVLFWNTMGLSDFDVKKVSCYQELEEAYLSIDKKSADLTVHEFQYQNMGLTSIPSDLIDLFQVHSLDLSENFIAEIPEKLLQQRGLYHLCLDNNQLFSLPENIGNLNNLAVLSLNSNQISSLPKSIGELTYLESLDLCNNHLTSLPDSIGDLPRLERLFLMNNKLEYLPENLINLQSLCELFVCDNPLISLPKNLLVWIRNRGEGFCTDLTEKTLCRMEAL